jgi:hypothetical protein
LRSRKRARAERSTLALHHEAGQRAQQVGFLAVAGEVADRLLAERAGLVAGLVGAQGGDDAAVGATVLGLAGATLFVFWLCVGVPGIITGIGLLKFKRWSRILGIVLSAIRLIQIPIGTIIGAYGLWVLFHKDTEALFEK